MKLTLEMQTSLNSISLKLNVDKKYKTLLLPYSDYSSWQRILTNLIINAVEAAEHKDNSGSVEIKLFNDRGNDVKIEIIDDGIGMDDGTLKNFTTRGFTKGKKRGQGFGVNQESVNFVEKYGEFNVSSKLGEGTKITIVISKSKTSEHTQKRTPLSPRLLLNIKRVSFIGIFGLLGLSMLNLLIPPPEVMYVNLINQDEVHKTAFRGIEALDKNFNIIWDTTFTDYFLSIGEEIEFTKPLVHDINVDGTNEILLPMRTWPHLENTNSVKLFCFSGTGKKLWEYQTGPRPYRAIFDYDIGSEGAFTTIYFRIYEFNKREPHIFIIAACHMYPTQALILDGEGNKLREYWHAGNFYVADFIKTYNRPIDFDEDGRVELVFYAQNNRVGWSPAVFMMEYEDFSGQSIPYIDSVFEKAGEDVYYVFGHAWVNDGPGFAENGMPLNCVGMHGATFRRYASLNIRSYEFSTNDGRTIRFNPDMSLDTIIVDFNLFSEWWDERSKQIKKPRPWNEQDIEQLYGYRKYVDGELVVDSIMIAPEKYDWQYWAR